MRLNTLETDTRARDDDENADDDEEEEIREDSPVASLPFWKE